MEFDKNGYINSGIWNGNEYLIDPETAVKRCLCCDELHYSSEFPDLPELVDGKFPVCIYCFKARSKKTAVSEIVNGITGTRLCAECGRDLHISYFTGSYKKSVNQFDKKCSECRPEPTRWWEDATD